METNKLNLKADYVEVLKNENYENKIKKQEEVSIQEQKRRIVDRRETKKVYLNYDSLENNEVEINMANRDIDSQALMLQVRLENDDKLETDLEDPKVTDYLNKYIDSRHPRKKLGKVTQNNI